MLSKEASSTIFWDLWYDSTVTYTDACGNIVNTIMTNRHSSLKNIPLTLYSKWLRKGYERVMCERWVGDWTGTATYWSPVPLSLAALLSRSAGLLNLVLTATNCNNWLQTNWTCLSHWVISLFDTHLVPMSVASAPNSTRPQLRLYPDIFDRIHLFLDWRLGRRSICYTTRNWMQVSRAIGEFENSKILIIKKYTTQ